MALRSVITTLALATLLAAPAGADQRERHRQNDTRNQSEQRERAREDAPARERAVPRAQARRDAEPPPQADRQEANRQAQRAAEQQSLVQPRREIREERHRFSHDRFGPGRTRSATCIGFAHAPQVHSMRWL